MNQVYLDMIDDYLRDGEGGKSVAHIVGELLLEKDAKIARLTAQIKDVEEHEVQLSQLKALQVQERDAEIARLNKQLDFKSKIIKTRNNQIEWQSHQIARLNRGIRAMAEALHKIEVAMNADFADTID